jgi:hypothetical protein
MLGDARRRRQPGPFRDHSSTAQPRWRRSRVGCRRLSAPTARAARLRAPTRSSPRRRARAERPGRRTRGGARPDGRVVRSASSPLHPTGGVVLAQGQPLPGWRPPQDRRPQGARLRLERAEALMRRSPLEGKRSDQRGTPRGHNYLGRNASPRRAAASLGYVMAHVGWLALSCANGQGASASASSRPAPRSRRK